MKLAHVHTKSSPSVACVCVLYFFETKWILHTPRDWSRERRTHARFLNRFHINNRGILASCRIGSSEHMTDIKTTETRRPRSTEPRPRSRRPRSTKALQTLLLDSKKRSCGLKTWVAQGWLGGSFFKCHFSMPRLPSFFPSNAAAF